MRDEETLLRLLGNAFVTGDILELLPALTDDCKYSSDLSGFQSFGKDAIVERWVNVNKQPDKRLCFFEIIPSYPLIRDKENLPSIYESKHCIKLSVDEPDNLAALVFIKIDENGLISEIYLCRDSEFIFINALIMDSPLTVKPIKKEAPGEFTISVGEMLRSIYGEEYAAKALKDMQKPIENSSVFIWREADKFVQKWLPNKGYRIIKSEIQPDCVAYRCEQRGLNYTVFLYAFGELKTTLLDGDYCKHLISLPISADSTILVLYLKVIKNKDDDGAVSYHILNYAGKESPIDLWQVQMLIDKFILRFFTEKETTDNIFDFIRAFNEQDIDVLQALLSPDAGIELSEIHDGMLLNSAVFNQISRLFEKYGALRIGYVRYNDVIYNLAPYLKGFGFFGFSFDDEKKIINIKEYPLDNKYAELIVTDEEIPDSSMRYIPDIVSADFLRPETTQRFAIKLRFENGETRKFCFPRAQANETRESVRFKSYVFTDKIFANGWLTVHRTLEKHCKKFNSNGQGIEFMNGFSIGKVQLYRESQTFYEPEILNEIVFENENYRIIKTFEWRGSSLYFDEEANLYGILLPGGFAFNYKGNATIALPDGQRATNLDFSYMKSFQEDLALVSISGHGYGFIDKNMVFAAPPRFSLAYSFVNGFARVGVREDKKLRWFYINKSGKELLFTNLNGTAPSQKYKRLCDFSEGMARVSTEEVFNLAYYSDYMDEAGVWGYVNSAGVEIVPPQYIYAMDFENGLAQVCKGKWTRDEKWNNNYITGGFWTEEERWGFIDKAGQEVIPCVFDEIKRHRNWENSKTNHKYFAVHYGGWETGKWGIIDSVGKWVVEPAFCNVDYGISEEGCFTFSDDDEWPNSRKGIYSIHEKRALFEPQFSDVSFLDNGLFCVKIFDKKLDRDIEIILDKTGKAVFPSEYSFISKEEDFYKVTIRENGLPDRNGIIDKNGGVIVPCKYSIPSLGGISWEKHIFIFEEDGKQGVKNFDEENVIPAIYDTLSGVGKEFLTACIGSKENSAEGLLLLDGTQVLPIKFESVNVHNERITAKHETGISGYIIEKK